MALRKTPGLKRVIRISYQEVEKHRQGVEDPVVSVPLFKELGALGDQFGPWFEV